MESPQYYVDRAVELEKQGKYAEAAKEWRNARTASIGHGRRARYEENHLRCKGKANES
jgi:hypothetical protein